VICVLTFGLRLLAVPLHIPSPLFYMPAWYQAGVTTFGRATIQSQLQRLPGNQLAIVRYSPEHPPFEEWVYNDADIDRSKVVWGRDMGPEQNLELIHFFKDRKVWLVEPDVIPPKLSVYPMAQATSGLDTDKHQSGSDEPKVR